MIRKWIVNGAGLLWIALGVGSGAGKLWAAPQAATDQAKPGYSLAEYNQYQAADKETNPQQKVKLLDAFVMAYPNSTLMPYVYRDYYTTYMALKNYAQVIEYADRMIALGDKIPITSTPTTVITHKGRSSVVSGPVNYAILTKYLDDLLTK